MPGNRLPLAPRASLTVKGLWWASLLLLAGCGGDQKRADEGEASKPRARLVTTFECPRDKALTPEAAKRVSEEALPQVWAALDSSEQRVCWGSGIDVLGFAGGPEAFARIRAFIETRSPLFARTEDMYMIQRAFMALGHLVKEDRHPRSAQQALDYLMESTDPLNWVKRSIDWKIDAVIRRELIHTLTRAATSALGVSRRDEARAHLVAMALDSAERKAFAFKFQTVRSAMDSVEDLINLHVLPPGRVVFAMGEVLLQLKGPIDSLRNKRGVSNFEKHALSVLSELRVIVERVRNDALTAWRLEREWLTARQGEETYVANLKAADSVADARLSGFHGQLESLVHLVDDAQAQDDIEKIAEIVFPNGPLALINSDYIEQIGFTLAAMDRLKQNFVGALGRLRLNSHVEVVIQAHLDLRKALESGQAGAGFEAVIQARAELQTALRILIATAVARYPGWQESDRTHRVRILGPLLEQNEQVDGFLARHVPVRDVNPETGQELAPLEEGGTALKDDGPRLGDQ